MIDRDSNQPRNQPSNQRSERDETRATAVAYARGLMGGMLLGVPVLMTMEVWWEGFYVPAWRILLLYLVNYGVLCILQHYSGLHYRKTPAAQARAALVAYGIGVIAATLMLALLGVLRGHLELRDFAGKVMLESVPVSIGASVAISEFGEESRVTEKRREHVGYWGSLGMALAGAVFFGFGVAATEEPLKVAMQMTWRNAFVLVALSLVQVHAIVYAVDFKARRGRMNGAETKVGQFVRDALSTYALALVVGAFFLWTYGELGSQTGLAPTAYMLATIGFVTSFGAAAGELLI